MEEDKRKKKRVYYKKHKKRRLHLPWRSFLPSDYVGKWLVHVNWRLFVFVWFSLKNLSCKYIHGVQIKVFQFFIFCKKVHAITFLNLRQSYQSGHTLYPTLALKSISTWFILIVRNLNISGIGLYHKLFERNEIHLNKSN